VLLISVTLAVFLSIVGTIGLVAYRMVKTRPSSDQSQTQPGDEASSDEPDGLAVEHGQLARRAELHAHGKLYFVPVGKQAIPIQSLADYYRRKFGIGLIVLSQVEVRPTDCVPDRHQCIAQELQAEMTTTYAEIARNPDSVMIALTDEDIFPRDLDWEFTYDWNSTRTGIVSTHRLDPAFWGEPRDEELRLARTKQMLTKHIAMQYFHLPENVDPSSVLYTSLAPDGSSDDIYDSDLHSEESANGRRGNDLPCLSFTYSYKTHRAKLDSPLLSDCYYSNPAHAGEEVFETSLDDGRVTQRSLDLELNSIPKIEFKRGHNPLDGQPMDFGLGWGASHSYNTRLSFDGLASFAYVRVIHEDGTGTFLMRLDKRRGFSPDAIYESNDEETYGARLSWRAGQYRLQYRDGASATFLACDNPNTRCYWIGYADAKGNTLRFERDASQELHRLVSSDSQEIVFRYDDHHRIATAEASNGKHVSYAYDEAGRLARVQRADGQVAFYEYDSGHRMTSFSVARRPQAAPKNVLSNQYDAKGRLVRQAIAGVGVFKMDYMETNQDEDESELRLTTPAGQILTVSVKEDEEYMVRAAEIRFPKAAR
jgi:YD repeat-containing protein